MTLWGGRFREDPDQTAWAFTTDTSDRRLLLDDVTGSLAHAAMLGRVGLLSEDEASELERGLRIVADEAKAETFEFVDSDEDVHSAVARRLEELVGGVAGKLGTGRSRNDQVALALRLYLMRTSQGRIDQLENLVDVLVNKAEEAGETIVASYSHLQQAQAIPLAHHLLAYAWMFQRDRDRFASAIQRIAISPAGAGAGAGSSLPLDPEGVAAELELPKTFPNSLDAVAGRDFAAEYVFCCAQAAVHLSRLGEDLVLWATTEFGWATFADRHTTGSSALPHKKNPDVAELARGKSASLIGDVTTLLTLQKGLSLGYHRDLQEDKRAVIHADDTLAAALDAVAAMLTGAHFEPPEPSSWVGALDLAEVLVQRGVAFDDAHRAVGRLVAELIQDGRELSQAEPAELASADPRLRPTDIPSVRQSVDRRSSPGSASFDSIRDQIKRLQTRRRGNRAGGVR